jgi:hypothetical protein
MLKTHTLDLGKACLSVAGPVNHDSMTCDHITHCSVIVIVHLLAKEVLTSY